MRRMLGIAAGLSALAVAGGKVGGQAIQDGYNALKSLILSKFRSRQPRLEEHIDGYVADQTTREQAETALREAGAAGDQEVVDRAVALLRQAEAASPGISGGLVGQINAQGVIVAHTISGPINQQFGGPPQR